MKVFVGYDDSFECAVHVFEPRVIAGETLCGIGTWAFTNVGGNHHYVSVRLHESSHTAHARHPGLHKHDVEVLLAEGAHRLLATAGCLGLGLVMARQLQVALFQVHPNDPTVYAAIVVTFTLAGLLACTVPALRATRVNLVEALRP